MTKGNVARRTVRRIPRDKKPSHWARDVLGKDVKFAVEGFLPRGVVSSVYAPRDAGKTTVAIHILASLSGGELFGADHPRRRSLFNSQEDSLETVIKPRLEAHGAHFGEPGDEHPWLAITAERWTFPDDLEGEHGLRAKLSQAKAGGAPFDLVVLDSLAQHLVRLNSIGPMTAAMTGLIKTAEDFDLAILPIGHLAKSKGSTVESAIYGASVLQNLSKGIFVFGPIPDEPVDDDEDDPVTENPRFALACERTGWGPKPPTVIFTRELVSLEAYEADQARLDYAGVGDYTAWQVKEFSKMSVKGAAADKGKTELAVNWILATLISAEARDEDSGMDGRDLRKQAKADGAFSSVATWERATKLAKLQGVTSKRRDGSNRHVWWITKAPIDDDEEAAE